MVCRIMFSTLLLAVWLVAAFAESDTSPNRAVNVQVGSVWSGVEVNYLILDQPATAWVGALKISGNYAPPLLDSDDDSYSYSGKILPGIQRRWYRGADRRFRPYLGAGLGTGWDFSYSRSPSSNITSFNTYSFYAEGLGGVEGQVTERTALTAQYSLLARYYYSDTRRNYQNADDEHEIHRGLGLYLSGFYLGITVFFQ